MYNSTVDPRYLCTRVRYLIWFESFFFCLMVNKNAWWFHMEINIKWVEYLMIQTTSTLHKPHPALIYLGEFEGFGPCSCWDTDSCWVCPNKCVSATSVIKKLHIQFQCVEMRSEQFWFLDPSEQITVLDCLQLRPEQTDLWCNHLSKY